MWSSYRTANAILNHNAHKNRDIRHSPRYTKGWLLGLLHSFYGDLPNCCYGQGKAFEYLLMLGIEKLIYLPSYICMYVCFIFPAIAHDLSIHADVQRLLAGKKQPGN